MKERQPKEYDEVQLIDGKIVTLLDKLDDSHFLADYGNENEELENLTLTGKTVSLEQIKEIL